MRVGMHSGLELMSDSAALEFTIDKQISRTFGSVDLSQLVYVQTDMTFSKIGECDSGMMCDVIGMACMTSECN